MKLKFGPSTAEKEKKGVKWQDDLQLPGVSKPAVGEMEKTEEGATGQSATSSKLGLTYEHENRICSADMTQVGRMTFRVVLQQGAQLRIPMFQRRYCWSQPEQAKLLTDLQQAPVHGHNLGRVLVHRGEPKAGEEACVTVIDGQQRCTTLMLLLAAIRDTLLERHTENPKAHETSVFIDTVLFVSPPTALDGPRHWERCRLVPTHLDRGEYCAALLPACLKLSAGASTTGTTSCVKAGKAFFDRVLAHHTLSALLALHKRVLDRATMLYFGVRETDLMTIYERQAVKDGEHTQTHTHTHTYTHIYTHTHTHTHTHTVVFWPRPGGVTLAGADLVRNLLLSYFPTEIEQEQVLSVFWLPVEQACSDSQGAADPARLEALFETFLANAKSGVLPSAAVREGPAAMMPPGVRARPIAAWVQAGKDAYVLPTDPSQRTPVDMLGGIYARMKRFVLSLIPEQVGPGVVGPRLAQQTAEELLRMLANWATDESWRPPRSCMADS